MDIKKIREAVNKNRGGWENATNEEIITIWRSLDAETQKKYMETIKAEPQRHEKN